MSDDLLYSALVTNRSFSVVSSFLVLTCEVWHRLKYHNDCFLECKHNHSPTAKLRSDLRFYTKVIITEKIRLFSTSASLSGKWPKVYNTK